MIRHRKLLLSFRRFDGEYGCSPFNEECGVNMSFDPAIFWSALFSSDYLTGAWVALSLAICSMAGAVVLGFLIALARQSKNSVLRGVGVTYVWFFRAIPTLLIFLVVWNAAPQLWPVFRESWFNPFLACFIGMSIVEAAYMAEILRSAMTAVEDGQRTAARALGITPVRTLFRVVMPQAIRTAIPPTSNEFIAVLKYTSLASVISLKELMTFAGINVSRTFRYAEYYTAAAVYYLVIVSLLMAAQWIIERRLQWTSTKKTLLPIRVAA
jgi:His/Glu/Gln/Arg/opine family amino acid ABC transporter permease subunit